MYQVELSPKDIDYVIDNAAPDCQDKEELKKCIREDMSFRKNLVSDEKLFDAVMQNPAVILKEISPVLFFEILLRKAIKEMENNIYTVERTIAQKIPVFDAQESTEFFSQEEIFYYLVHLLDSFSRVEKDTPQDVSIDRLIKMGEKAGAFDQFLIQKRIGDVCLLQLGIFPEHLTYDFYYLFSNLKPPMTGEERRGNADYEFLGREYYGLASKNMRAKLLHLTRVLKDLSENLYLAKKPLNFISERYLSINIVK